MVNVCPAKENLSDVNDAAKVIPAKKPLENQEDIIEDCPKRLTS